MPFLHDYKRLGLSSRLEKEIYSTGLRHSIFYPNGGFYKGEWLNGVQDGKGKQLLPNGLQYEGDWKCNKKHGFGVQSQYIPEERRFRLTYIGDHVNGKFHGFGRRHYADGSLYEGEFKNNNREGFGKCWYADGSYYEGQWAGNKKDGVGLFVQVNGNRFEGEWRNGVKDGWGKFYHLDSGQVQEGFWSEGVCKTSLMTDISYRQSAIEPTSFPIPLLQDIRDTSSNLLLNRDDSVTLKGNCESSLLLLQVPRSEIK